MEPSEKVKAKNLAKRGPTFFKIQKTPFKVKSQGEVKYQWFTVTPGFSEDKWIRAVEIIPGNRAVVHHVLAFIQLPGQTQLRGAKGYLAGYVPGLRADSFPAGMAKRILHLITNNLSITQIHKLIQIRRKRYRQ